MCAILFLTLLLSTCAVEVTYLIRLEMCALITSGLSQQRHMITATALIAPCWYPSVSCRSELAPLAKCGSPSLKRNCQYVCSTGLADGSPVRIL